ncbi:MAG: PIN domain-containing protein [Bacteroidales bacterium]|nr:PIN domain-containing protein [Bacteroidales bacterium]
MDTCVCIALIKQVPSVVEHIRKVGVSECKISDLTTGELYFGAFKSGRKEHFDDVIEIDKLFEQYPTTYSMREYGDVRWQLERMGKRIDSIDLLIGVTALHEDLTLVTGNVKHFERIPGLRIENWME